VNDPFPSFKASLPQASSLPGEDLALGMAMFFEIPLIDDFLDRTHGLILDAIGAPALSLCNSFVMNRRL
jgi:hypothetical protein